MSDNGSRHALIISPYYPPAIGGVEQYAANVTRELTKLGWRVTVITTGPHRRGVRVEAGSPVTVHRLPTAMRVSNTPIGPGWRRAVRDVVAANDVDVVNAHAPVPGLADIAATAIGDLPLVLTYHTGVMRKGKVPVDAMLRAYESLVVPRTAQRAQQVICSSGFVESTFPTSFVGKSTVIQPGIDLERFTLSAPPRVGPMLFVGTLAGATAYKGLSDALRAIALLRDRGVEVGLNIVGDGDARGEYEALARQLDIRDSVSFAGALSGDALVEAYRSCRALVLPTHFDSFPTVLVEAMAVGRPVITTPVGGIPELVTDGVNGRLISPGDHDALADAIASMDDSRCDLEAMGRAGRERVVDALSWSRQGRRTAAVFERAIDTAAGAGPTRLAVATPYFSPHVGGVESYAMRLSQHLSSQPDFAPPVIVTTGNSRRRTEFARVRGLPVFRLPTWFTVSNTPVNPLWFWQLRRLNRRLGIEAVHAHAPVPLFAEAALLAAGGRRKILTYHSGSMAKHAGHLDRLVRVYETLLLPRLLARADGVTVASPTCLGADLPNAQVLAPGVDVGAFRPPAADTDRRSVLYTGRLERSSAWKGVHVLIAAFAKVAQRFPDTELRLAGDGDAIASLAQLADSLGIRSRVTFLGGLDHATLASEYGAARVAVLPSLTESESFGMSLVEAMACATPVIGSRIGGIPHVISHERNGLLVAPGDVAALADALSRLLGDAALARRLGEHGRRAALESFDWSRTLTAYLALLRGPKTMAHRL
jgi:glycosyltransferase involved in cell wall biosynthesis